MLLLLACLVIQAIGATAIATATPAKHAHARQHGSPGLAAHILPPALKATATRSRRADRQLVARAKGVKRCLRANRHHPNRCKSARRALQRAGVRLARIELRLARLARAGGRAANFHGARASRYGRRNARRAPVLTVTGQNLSWNRVSYVNTYVLVIKVPRQADEYSVVSGVSLTPPPVPGVTVKYSVRTTAEGSAWAREKSITYPAAAPAPEAPEVKTPETPKPEEKGKAPEEKAKTPEHPKAPEEVRAPEKVDTQAAPELKVSGQKLVWNPLAGVSTYVLVTKVPGRTDVYSAVSGVSLTPPAVPGATVNYSVRTAVEGSAWAPEVSITYPAATVPTPPPTPPAPVGTTSGGVIIGVNDGSGWGPLDAERFIAAGITSERLEGQRSSYSHSVGFHNNTVIVGNTPDGTRLSSISIPSWTSSALADVKAAVAAGDTLDEVGNEMFLKGGAAEPAKYAEMYMSLANAVDAAGIKAKLLFNSYGQGWLATAVKTEPGLLARVDGFTQHPYGRPGENNQGNYGPGSLKAEHSEAVLLGFAHTDYYVTEYGVAIGGPTAAANTVSSQAEQAERIKTVFTELIATGYVKGIWYYQTHDDGTGNWGLIERQTTGSSPFITRPSLAVVAAFAQQQGS